MSRLPHTVHFNDLDYPELAEILRGIDVGIAAIVASDPSMRGRRFRRRQRGKQADRAVRQDAATRRHAA